MKHMINWILNNLSTIIVAAILLIIVIMIIKHQIQTRHTCSSGCGGCPMAGKCHTHKK